MIRNHLPETTTFEPEAITAMSKAFEHACTALNVPAHDNAGRETVATRIIDLARNGVIDPAALSTRVVAETQAMRTL